MMTATQVAVNTAGEYQCFYDLIIALLDLSKVAKWACLQQGISDNGADSSLTPISAKSEMRILSSDFTAAIPWIAVQMEPNDGKVMY